MDTLFYKIVKPIVTLLFYVLYRPTVIGRENIPNEGPIVLAGNHTKWLDPVMLVAITKRQVHFLAKIELFNSFKTRWIAKGMGCIPVNRKVHDGSSLATAISDLNKGACIGIFPEGTINRTNDVIMPFKMGAVKMSFESSADLVPFAITGKYKLFRKGICIEFFKPMELTDELDKMNDILMKTVSDGIIKNGDKDGK